MDKMKSALNQEFILLSCSVSVGRLQNDETVRKEGSEGQTTEQQEALLKDLVIIGSVCL